jgi:hypothetical protein
MTMLVQQRTPHDCAICCMAMLTGRAYEDVLATVGDAFDPEKGMGHEGQALERLGFDHTFANGVPVGDFTCCHRGYAVSPEFFRDFAWGRRALMNVPSLNRPGGWHMIYWDGAKVWDPSILKTYDQWAQLRPEEMVIFREVIAA